MVVSASFWCITNHLNLVTLKSNQFLPSPFCSSTISAGLAWVVLLLFSVGLGRLLWSVPCQLGGSAGGGSWSRMVSPTFLAFGSLSAGVKGTHEPWVFIIHLGQASSYCCHLAWRGAREGKLQCASTSQFFACFTLAIVPLDKGSSISNAKDNVGGDTSRHVQTAVVTVTGCYYSVSSNDLVRDWKILNCGQNRWGKASPSRRILTFL